MEEKKRDIQGIRLINKEGVIEDERVEQRDKSVDAAWLVMILQL